VEEDDGRPFAELFPVEHALTPWFR